MPERLDVVVEDDAAMRFPGESDFDVRGRRTERQLAGLLHDSAPAVPVLHMDPMHPSDELRPKVDDVLHRMADPRFGGIEDLRVAVDRRDERAAENPRRTALAVGQTLAGN